MKHITFRLIYFKKSYIKYKNLNLNKFAKNVTERNLYFFEGQKQTYIHKLD